MKQRPTAGQNVAIILGLLALALAVPPLADRAGAGRLLPAAVWILGAAAFLGLTLRLAIPRPTLLAAALLSVVVVVPFLSFADTKVAQDHFGAPLTLVPARRFVLGDLLARAPLVFAACLGVLLYVGRRARPLGAAVRAGWGWCRDRPGRAIGLCAAVAVIASSYPIIFLGRSFVSPNVGTGLLYDVMPTLPGYTENRTMESSGSDVGAMMWHHLPLSVLEHRALFRDHELPLWDRYNSAGVPLLGQGQSMFGDPLHMILPVLFDGAAWAWDLKYLAAKWLLAIGLGLLAWEGTRHLPSALLVAFASAFVGYFVYRFNHPAFFSFCYGPWILYGWARAARAPELRATAGWTGGLILANWAEMTSGTVKEAYMLLLTMNLTGLLVLALDAAPWRQRLRRFAVLAWGGALFALLSAPIWLTFADALKRSFTNYDNPLVYQIEPSALIGLFDEIFYRPFNAADWVLNPSANFVLLLGVLAFLVYLRHTSSHRLAVAVAIGALVQLAVAFGLVPPLWIAQVPLLRNVVHIDDSFSGGLILNLIVLAGFGFAEAGRRLGRPEGRFDLILGLLLLLALIFPYLAITQVFQRGPYSYLAWGQVIHRSAFVWTCVAVLPAAAIGLMLVTRRMLVRQAATPTTVLLALTLALILLWRQGLHAGTGFTNYVFNPSVRVDFHARSPAVAAVRDDRSEPFRTVGIDWVFAPGWTGVYDLEGIGGPDSLINGQYRELALACGLDVFWGWRIVADYRTLAALKPVYDFLNVKYYLDSPAGRGRAGGVLPTVARADLDVYRSETPWPRAFFTDQVWPYRDLPDLVALIQANPGRPFAAVQPGRPGAPAHLAFAAGDPAARIVVPARDYHLTTNRTSFVVTAPGPGVIVLQEAWVRKNFRATVNGAPAVYFRVNHAFKGIAVDRAGTYRVGFAYWPEDMTLSLALAGAGLIGLAGSAWFTFRRK